MKEMIKKAKAVLWMQIVVGMTERPKSRERCPCHSGSTFARCCRWDVVDLTAYMEEAAPEVLDE